MIACKVGDVIRMTSFDHVTPEGDRFGFNAPDRKTVYVFVLLGTELKNGDIRLDIDRRYNEMGWFDGTWRPIEEAKKDNTPILARLKLPLPYKPGDKTRQSWGGKTVVLRHSGLEGAGWRLDAPVGAGGFPDEWIEGWMDVPGGI